MWSARRHGIGHKKSAKAKHKTVSRHPTGFTDESFRYNIRPRSRHPARWGVHTLHDGYAGSRNNTYKCNSLDLYSFTPLADLGSTAKVGNNIWGWAHTDDDGVTNKWTRRLGNRPENDDLHLGYQGPLEAGTDGALQVA
ncbi:hypothetical protein B0H14DRAFT_2586262 [Mycena olivaceomarginata]|nr:hypothetical protein B0H14DRAFT_2586262 [Mycena olivaceomarginata]